MGSANEVRKKPGKLRRWIRRGFVAWAFVSTAWLVDSYRTRGVDPETLRSGSGVLVVDGDETLRFLPEGSAFDSGLVFLCGAGVAAEAYAPMLRPIAALGHAVFVVRLPYRLAPLESHKRRAIARALGVVHSHPEIAHWVVAGHSLGGALASRLALENPEVPSALVLIGTTHPKRDDLSTLDLPVTKVYGSRDRVAPKEKIHANRGLLPADTRWIEIDGGNHSGFAHYGHQLFDGEATIERSEQQRLTRAALLDVLALPTGNLPTPRGEAR